MHPLYWNLDEVKSLKKIAVNYCGSLLEVETWTKSKSLKKIALKITSLLEVET
jgi:hypothetical protein